jgi:hypothetical protein
MKMFFFSSSTSNIDCPAAPPACPAADTRLPRRSCNTTDFEEQF